MISQVSSCLDCKIRKWVSNIATLISFTNSHFSIWLVAQKFWVGCKHLLCLDFLVGGMNWKFDSDENSLPQTCPIYLFYTLNETNAFFLEWCFGGLMMDYMTDINCSSLLRIPPSQYKGWHTTAPATKENCLYWSIIQLYLLLLSLQNIRYHLPWWNVYLDYV